MADPTGCSHWAGRLDRRYSSPQDSHLCLKTYASSPKARKPEWLNCNGERSYIEWCKHVNPDVQTRSDPQAQQICGRLKLSGGPAPSDYPHYVLQHEDCQMTHRQRAPGAACNPPEHIRIAYGCTLYMFRESMFRPDVNRNNFESRDQKLKYHVPPHILEKDPTLGSNAYKLNNVGKVYHRIAHLEWADEMCIMQFRVWHAQWLGEQINSNPATPDVQASASGTPDFQASASGVAPQ
ncbi:hypothetical protein BT63DRAFT_444018 [Microthyrium microscopicum]|uniref:Uncharacterized protein n=1 Tax=Microthyrium microscopicum TaxID=703497 RepID=A0A6A6TXS4_9PEZI|nr:hypothetical protein BT63DRAFT_444018 [Microthyrium microscopicum]